MMLGDGIEHIGVDVQRNQLKDGKDAATDERLTTWEVKR